MTGAMYAAIAGLRTHMQNLNVIGNNVANVNTNGYKASRAVFKTSLYTSLSGGSDGTDIVGGTNPSQIGYGASVANVDIDMSTGNYSVTGKSTDLMLDGDGFFVVGDKDIANNFDGTSNDINRLTSLTLTRVGDFGFKSDGYLGKNDGNVVYGFLCIGYYSQEEIDAGKTAEGKDVPEGTKPGAAKFSDQLVPIHYPRVQSTTSYTLTRKDATTDDVTMIRTYTLKGQDTTTTNGVTTTRYVWSVSEYNPVTNTVTTPPPADVTTTTAELTAADVGLVAATDTLSAPHSSMEVVYPQPGADGRLTEDKDLSFGQFQLITIDQNTGIITAVSNETKEVVTIGCIAVGTVTNPNGVTSMGDNYFKASDGSGQMTISILGGNAEAMGITQVNQSLNPNATTVIDGLRPRSGGETKMLSNGLEMSKTDLAQEIANMILTQRGYQANTRIITVTDSMLEELVNMKR